MPEPQENKAEEFQAEARAARTGLLREFWEFLKHNKKWWLTPILVVILLVGLLVMLTGTGMAPFIYALF